MREALLHNKFSKWNLKDRTCSRLPRGDGLMIWQLVEERWNHLCFLEQFYDVAVLWLSFGFVWHKNNFTFGSSNQMSVGCVIIIQLPPANQQKQNSPRYFVNSSPAFAEASDACFLKGFRSGRFAFNILYQPEPPFPLAKGQLLTRFPLVHIQVFLNPSRPQRRSAGSLTDKQPKLGKLCNSNKTCNITPDCAVSVHRLCCV